MCGGVVQRGSAAALLCSNVAGNLSQCFQLKDEIGVMPCRRCRDTSPACLHDDRAAMERTRQPDTMSRDNLTTSRRRSSRKKCEHKSENRMPSRSWHPNHPHAAALWRACQHGVIEVVSDLLQSGVDVNCCTHLGECALHIASYYNHPNIVKRLLEEPSIAVNINAPRAGTPLHVAAYNGHAAAAYLLLQHPSCDPCAKMFRHPKYSLSLKTVTNSQTGSVDCSKGFMTPMMLAAQEGHKTVVRLFLHQPSLDMGSEGIAALHLAAVHGHHDVAEILLDHPGLPMEDELRRSLKEEVIATRPTTSSACTSTMPSTGTTGTNPDTS